MEFIKSIFELIKNNEKYQKTVIIVLFIFFIIYIFYNKSTFQPYEIYYYLLFVIILFIKYFKDYILAVRNGEETKFLPAESLHISFDIVIASIGAVIVQISNINSQNGSSILLFIVILFLLASFFSEIIENSISKILLNVIIISLVITSFHFWFEDIKNSKILNSNESNVIQKSTYKVMLPYNDFSLVNNIGVKKFGNKKLLYIEEIKGLNEQEVKNQLIININNKIQPIIKTTDSNNIQYEIDDIIIQKL